MARRTFWYSYFKSKEYFDEKIDTDLLCMGCEFFEDVISNKQIDIYYIQTDQSYGFSINLLPYEGPALFTERELIDKIKTELENGNYLYAQVYSSILDKCFSKSCDCLYMDCGHIYKQSQHRIQTDETRYSEPVVMISSCC